MVSRIVPAAHSAGVVVRKVSTAARPVHVDSSASGPSTTAALSSCDCVQLVGVVVEHLHGFLAVSRHWTANLRCSVENIADVALPDLDGNLQRPRRAVDWHQPAVPTGNRVVGALVEPSLYHAVDDEYPLSRPVGPQRDAGPASYTLVVV